MITYDNRKKRNQSYHVGFKGNAVVLYHFCFAPSNLRSQKIGSERGTSKLVQVCADGSALVEPVWIEATVEA